MSFTKVSERKLSCGCEEHDPDCKCHDKNGVDGAVNVNVILDSNNRFATSTDRYDANLSLNPAANVIRPSVNPVVAQPAIVPYRPPMVYYRDAVKPPVQVVNTPTAYTVPVTNPQVITPPTTPNKDSWIVKLRKITIPKRHFAREFI